MKLDVLKVVSNGTEQTLALGAGFIIDISSMLTALDGSLYVM
jgi:hypothetical protein